MSASGHGLFDQIIARSQTAAGKLQVRSALNPMLWLCPLISLPCFFGAWLLRGVEPLSSVVMYSGVAPIAVTCLMAAYFAVRHPDKLQSEEYQIRHEALDLIRQKGSSIAVSPSSLEAIANPVVAALPGPAP
jgi:hypothetical protein